MSEDLSAETNLRITEIFFSLQGEAQTVGKPTVFVRLTGCPLRCTYCDSEYAFHGGERMSLSQVLTQVVAHGARHVCVTGGEPLAQPNSLHLLRMLCDEGFPLVPTAIHDDRDQEDRQRAHASRLGDARDAAID